MSEAIRIDDTFPLHVGLIVPQKDCVITITQIDYGKMEGKFILHKTLEEAMTWGLGVNCGRCGQDRK